MTDKAGPLVRLWGIDVSQLPSPTATPEELKPFLASIFQEGIPFITDVPAATSASTSSSWKPKGTKTFPHSTAAVHLYERTVSSSALAATAKEHQLPHVAPAASKDQQQAETWALRRSDHEDAAKTGTAAWGEWVRSFKEEHAEAEQAFTPTVLGTEMKRQWDCGGAETEIEVDGDTWVEWTLKLEESLHKLPAPLKNRVFPVLQATASVRGRREFAVVQIAVHDGSVAPRADGAVRGAYTSVERLRDTGDGKVEWVMGTASDAKGVLPGWMQKMAVPGQVAKDVDMFLEWIAQERTKKVERIGEETGV